MKTIWTLLFFVSVVTAQAQMWGVTAAGGAQASGAIYKTNADGTGFAIKAEFVCDPGGALPEGGHLVKHSNGKLYGTTFTGGAHGNGVIFEFNPATGTYTTVFDFEAAVSGTLSQNVMIHASNGKLYGVAYSGGANGGGTFYEFDPAGPTFTKRHDFIGGITGTNPDGNLVELGGKIYGLCYAGGSGTAGTMFRYDPATPATAPVNVHNFSTTSTGPGGFPRGLTVGSDNKLYGVALIGGAGGAGTIFSYDPAAAPGSEYVDRAHFTSPGTQGSAPQSTIVEHTNGKFYGMASTGGNSGRGMLYEFNPTTNTITGKYHVTFSGASGPTTEPVVGANGLLYGTVGQGITNKGILYSYDPATNTFSILKTYSDDGSDGLLASALIEESVGKFYGTARSGGTNGAGVLFDFTAGTTTYTLRHEFIYAPDGASPVNGMTLAPNGKFYGVTQSGGTKNDGTVFEYDPATDILTNKASFSAGTTGSVPLAAMTVYGNGKLYGLTSQGGIDSDGVLFEFDPSTSSLTKKADVSDADGRAADAPLLMGSDYKLYGFTKGGGSSALGKMISFDPATNTITGHASFLGTTNGRSPSGLLAYGTNGKMYGTTQAGGATNFGVVFEFNPADGSITKKADMATGTTGNLASGLILGTDGMFYGATWQGGPTGSGGIFQFNSTTNGLVQVHGLSGAQPITQLTHSTNGKVYGSTFNAASGGKLFEYNYVTDVFTNKYTFIASEGNPNNTLLGLKPINQKIYFNDLTKNVAEPPFDLPGVSTAGLPLTYVSSNPGVASIVGKTVTIHTVGSTNITASQAGNSAVNAATDVVAVLTIDNSQAPQTITFNPLADKTFGNADFGLTATASSGLAVTYASSNTAVATVAGSTVHIVGAGTTTITASQAGNASFLAATPVDQDLNVLQAPQTITLPDIAPMTTASPAFDPGATSTSGLTVTYTSSNLAVATVSGSMVTIVGAGTSTITAHQAGNTNYLAAPDVAEDLVVKATQTITFNALPTKNLLDVPFNLTATASSGLTVTYVSSNPAVASVSGATVTVHTVGSTNITASQAGNAGFVAAPDVVQPLNVVKVPQSITFDPLADKFVNDADFELTATASSGLAVSYSSSNSAVATVVGTTVNVIGVGTTTITATQVGDATYAPAAAVNQPLNVVKVSQTITFGTLADQFVNAADFDLTATASSGLAISYSSSNTAVATVTGSTVNVLTVGTTTITASQAGNASFDAAPSVPRTLNVVKAPQTITFAALGEKSETDAPFGLTATTSSGLAITYSSSNTAVATVSGSTVTIVAAGSTDITASQAGNGTFEAAANVVRTLTINNKTSQTITFAPLADKTFGNGPFGLTATASSGLTVSFASSNTSVATVSGTTVTIVGAGTTNITASQAGNATFGQASDVIQALNVLKAAQTITFNAIPDKATGSAPFDLDATSDSGLGVTYTSSNTAVATVSGATVTIVGAGTTTITAKQAGNANYSAAADMQRTLSVLSAQTITFNTLPNKTFGDAAFPLSATASSGLTVSYTSSAPSVATVSGSTVTIVGAGETTITATQSGNGTFIAATPVPRILTVDKANQTITFAEVTTKIEGGASFTVTGSSTSGLAVTFSTTGDEVTISGTTVTIVNPGSTTITANQGGNDNYNAATAVARTFCVNPAKPVIEATPEGNILTSSADEGNQWYKEGNAISGATNINLEVGVSGVYKVQATVDGCASEFSDDFNASVVGVKELSNGAPFALKLFPSPAKEKVVVQAPCTNGCRVTVLALDSRVMHGFDMTTEQAEVDVRGYSPGIYFIRVATSDGTIMGRFVRQ